jgi:hypothetical protein
LAHIIFSATDHRRHRAVGHGAGFIHQFAPPLHKFESRSKIECARRRVCRHFA